MIQYISIRRFWIDLDEMFVLCKGTDEKLSPDMSEVILVKPLMNTLVRTERKFYCSTREVQNY
jgi:hypothetical protein